MRATNPRASHPTPCCCCLPGPSARSLPTHYSTLQRPRPCHAGYFPGSGGAKDAGERAGKGHNINLPVERGFSDADLEALLPPVVEAVRLPGDAS